MSVWNGKEQAVMPKWREKGGRYEMEMQMREGGTVGESAR